MSDPSRFRPMEAATLAEETEEMRKASFAVMNKRNIASTDSSKGIINTVLEKSGTQQG